MKKKKKINKKIKQLTHDIANIIMFFAMIEARKIDKSRHDAVASGGKSSQK